jgi:hypothetical protein
MSDTPEYARTSDVNGLGSRLNGLEIECAACRAKTCARQDGHDLRLNSQHSDIEKIFESIDGLKSAVNKGMGGIAVLVVVIQALQFFLERVNP